MKLLFPIKDYKGIIPTSGPNSFGAKRVHDIHTGVDLFADVDTPVVAMCNGHVVSVGQFTGEAVQSPWWLDTQYVVIENDYGCILYGEIQTDLEIGQDVKIGDLIGTVRRVLKKDKGAPTSMLHIEAYCRRYEGCGEIWIDKQPDMLLDVTPLLLMAQGHQPLLVSYKQFQVGFGGNDRSIYSIFGLPNRLSETQFNQLLKATFTEQQLEAMYLYTHLSMYHSNQSFCPFSRMYMWSGFAEMVKTQIAYDNDFQENI